MTTIISETPWLDTMLARQKLNIKEFPGKSKNNDLIGSRFRNCGWGEEWDRGAITDETPWCAAEVGGALVDNGYPIPPKAVNLMARSYHTYGKACEIKRGAIGVMPRGKDKSKGHVVCCVNHNVRTGVVTVVEGNKDNALAIGTYHESVFLKNGWRWPIKATVKELRDAGSTEIAQADQAQIVAAAGTVATVTTIAAKTVEAAGNAAPVLDVINTTVLTPWDAIANLTTRIGIVQALLDAIVAAPWALPALAICWGLWRFGAVSKVKRLIRHMQGQAVSSQVFIPDNDPAEDLPEAILAPA